MFEISSWEIDDYATMEDKPMFEASRRTRIATAPIDFAFAWNRGDTSARKPRRKA
jgi:hypothetical protein